MDYEEFIPPMRHYPDPWEDMKEKAFLTKILQKWDLYQTNTHSNATEILQDVRIQNEHQFIHHSLTQMGKH